MTGTSMVQWLRLCASTARDRGSVPGWRNMILHAIGGDEKKKGVALKYSGQKVKGLGQH